MQMVSHLTRRSGDLAIDSAFLVAAVVHVAGEVTILMATSSSTVMRHL